MGKLKIHFILIAVAAVSIFVSGCTKSDKLKKLVAPAIADPTPPAPPVAALKAEFCSRPPDSIKGNTRLIFVIDRSGSNGSTDPDGSRRYQSLVQYIEANTPNKSYTQYYYISFQGAGAQSVTKDFTEHDPFLDLMRGAYASGADNDGTPYLAGINEATTAIQNAVTKEEENAKAGKGVNSSYYIVFFLSDGVPTDSTDDQIYERIRSLVKLQEKYSDFIEGVQFNTGYYYVNTPDAAAVERMKKMASEGAGKALEFGTGQKVDFSKFGLPERHIPIKLFDVFVRNKNIIWDTGILKSDSDGDGLSDDREKELGSDPTKFDSDGNGVNDLVESRLFTKPCDDETCKPDGAKKFINCSSVLKNDKGLYVDTDNDGLNDCEEKQLQSQYADLAGWDSNSDGIPDGLTFLNGLQLAKNAFNISFQDPDGDSVDNYNEIKHQMPPLHPNDKIVSLAHPLQYELKTLSETPTQSCYQVKVDDLMYLNESDSFEIQWVQATDLIKNLRYLTRGEKKMDTKTKQVIFTREDFK